MINKLLESASAAVADIRDGSTVMVGGFGEAGSPIELIHALIDHGARDLTVVSNNAGNGAVGLAALIANGRVRKLVCSFPRSTTQTCFPSLLKSNQIELELVPQGTLAERIRAGGAGIAAFYTPTAVGTVLAEGKETRTFAGRPYVLEHALRADFALIKAARADRLGNLTYNKAARNFGPIMCMAAKMTVVQVYAVGPAGSIDPEVVTTPGIFVQRLVEIKGPAIESRLIAEGATYP